MINQVGNLIQSTLANLYWTDEVYGLVTKLSEIINGENGPFEKSYPAVYFVGNRDCDKTGYIACLPDSKKRSVIYIEDNGTRLVRSERDSRYFEANVRVVCWLNYKLINQSEYNTDRYVYDILNALPDNPGNFGLLTKVKLEPIAIVEKDVILSPYTYPYVDAQLNTYPYDICAVDYRVSFAIGRECLEPINIEPVC